MRLILTTIALLCCSTVLMFGQATKMSLWELSYKKSAEGFYAKRLLELNEKVKNAATKKGKDQFIAQMEEVKEKLGMTEDERQEIAKMRADLKKLQENNSFKENDGKIAEATTKIDRLSKLALENFERSYYTPW